MKKIEVEHVVDKGIPIPVTRSLPLEFLDAGDSILFPLEHRNAVATQASLLKKRTGKTFTIKKVSDDSCRIWRTK